MTDMTMGQRIAQRRKMLNLSQEAFGEKMGVSRQAISKWEADGAVPEIDKLILMSKLFGVTVGWLLGTEDGEEPARAEEFTEAQLKMVEEIVRRYHMPVQKKRNWVPVIAVAGVVLLFMIGNFGSYVNSAITSIHSQMDSLYTYYSTIYSQLHSVSQRLEELAAGERLLTEYSLEAEGNRDLTGATVHFAATPRQMQPGEEAWLSVRLDGEEVAKVRCDTDGTAYRASVELPAVDGHTYYFQVVRSNGESSQEPLTKAYGCDQLASSLRGFFYMNYRELEFGKEMVAFDRMDLFFVEPKLLTADEAKIRDLTLVVSCDGAEQMRIPLLVGGAAVEEGEYVTRFLPNTDFHFTLNLNFPSLWVEGRETVLSVEAKLATGNTVTQPLMKWWYEANDIRHENIAPFA